MKSENILGIQLAMSDFFLLKISFPMLWLGFDQLHYSSTNE